MSFPPRNSRISYQKALAEALLTVPMSGVCHCGDASVSGDDSARTLRSLSPPRLALLLSGEHRISYCRKGVVVGATLRPGDFWFYPPHALESQTWESPCRFLGVVFRPNLTRFLAVDYPGGKWQVELTPHHYQSPMPRPANLDALIETLVLSTQTKTHPDTLGHLALAAFGLLADFLSEPEKTPPSQAGKAYLTWQQIEIYFHEQYHQPINRDMVASALGLNRSYVSELCRRYGGSSFQRLLEETRIAHARDLLSRSGLKVEAVGHMCGYTSGEYFIRAFKRATGQTPGAFRTNSDDWQRCRRLDP